MRSVLAFLTFTTAALAANPAGLLRYADPQAQALVGVEWATMSTSDYASALRSSFGDALTEMKGLDFIENLDRFVMSATSSRKAGDGTTILLAIEGNFNLAQLRKSAANSNALIQRYRNVEMLLTPANTDGMDFAIIDNRTVLLGDRRSLMDAIERMQGNDKDPEIGPAFVRAQALAGKTDLWMAGSPEVFSNGGIQTLQKSLASFGPGDPLANELLKGLRAAEAGGRLEVAFALHTQPAPIRTPAVAVAAAITAPAAGKTIKIYGLEEGTREVNFR